MISAIYHLDIASNEDDLAKDARKVADLADQLILPGGNTYKSIPLIPYILSLLPFCKLAKEEKICKQVNRRLLDDPFQASMGAWVSLFFFGDNFINNHSKISTDS